MEKAVGIGLFALLVVGVAFVQVHYYRAGAEHRADAEAICRCGKTEPVISPDES